MWSPSFIGIGAEKSATTWAWTMLNEHPQICMSQPKELNYFNVDENFVRSNEWFRMHFADTSAVCGEISPLYMDDARVAERLHNAWPDVRVLVMLRNPFDRAISHLFHDASVIYGKVASLEADDLKRLVAKDDKYIRRSRYAAALKPYFDRFAAEQIGVFFFDEMKRDSDLTVRRLYDFAGVETSFRPEQSDRKVNDSQDMRSAALMRLLKRTSQFSKRFAPTRAVLDWVCRKTQIRERVIRMVMVDKGRPEIGFHDVFDDAATNLIQEDLRELSDLLPVALPNSWNTVAPQRDSPELPAAA